MKEVNLFSFFKRSTLYRVTVTQDDDGLYHLNEETFVEPDKINVETGQPTPLVSRKDIHGSMSTEAYMNWIANALFNEAYMRAYSPLEKQWMLHT